MSRVFLVTGAAGGIGAEFCRQLLDSGNTVVACPRVGGSDVMDELSERHGAALHVVPMDVARDESVKAARRQIERQIDRIDVLINNAGKYPKESDGIEKLDLATVLEAFNVNTLGVLRVVQQFLPLLRQGRDRRLVQITSLMGSIQDNTSGGSYGYRISKTAMNMANRNLGHELGPEGFVSVVIHPGWVKTPMGGQAAPLAVEESARRILATVDDLTPRDNGKFFDSRGEPLPY